MPTSSLTYLPTAIPTAPQLAFQDWEFGLFLHFGIRTFFEGHRDWDGMPMSPVAFNPTMLDCNQWVQLAKQAGVRYSVLTAKHHDGFANWPSQFTNFSVASAPWRDGKGDVVREFTDACHQHDMKVGLYYSPADAASPVYPDPAAYDDYFINQISELLTGYGTIDLLWFDGCGSEGHVYNWPRITAEIRRLQPGILIFNMGDPDYRWVGNEVGVAPLPCWNTVESAGTPAWLPAECDCRMRLDNWFYSDQDEDTIKSVSELMGLYYHSVGRGCNLLINIGPDRRGLLPEKDAARLQEFSAEIRRRFSHPITTSARWEIVSNGWELTPGRRLLLDHVVIQEELAHGEHVRRFAIQVSPTFDDQFITVYEGYQIGHKAICPFPTIPAHKVRVRILEADGAVTLRAIHLYHTK